MFLQEIHQERLIMKIETIANISRILAGIKINKLTDKDVKTALVNDYLYLRKIIREADEERRELVDKFQSDWMDELEAVEAFRREDKPVEGHEEYLEAERDANKAIAEIFGKDVEVELAPVKLDAFLSACAGEEVTLEQIAFLQENGLIEE